MKFQVKYNPYSDLSNLAQYQLDNIKSKLNSEQLNGINLDIQACLISHAFLAEALINMAGYGLFRDKFKEGDSYRKKCNKVLVELDTSEVIGLKNVLDALQETRNDLAHAKPSRYEYELKADEDEFTVFNRPYDKYLNFEFIENVNLTLYNLWIVMNNNKLIEDYGMVTSAVEVS